MSVDFYACKCCGESRYEEYIGSCNKCGENIGTCCVVNDDVKSKYAHNYGYKFDSSNSELMDRYEKEGFSLYDKDGAGNYEEGDIIDDSGIDSKYCPFCSGETINKESLFDFIVEKFKIDAQKEWKLFKNKK